MINNDLSENVPVLEGSKIQIVNCYVSIEVRSIKSGLIRKVEYL